MRHREMIPRSQACVCRGGTFMIELMLNGECHQNELPRGKIILHTWHTDSSCIEEVFHLNSATLKMQDFASLLIHPLLSYYSRGILSRCSFQIYVKGLNCWTWTVTLFPFRLGRCGKWSTQQVSHKPAAEETDGLWCKRFHCSVWEHLGWESSR